jgi:hypothetical protein
MSLCPHCLLDDQLCECPPRDTSPVVDPYTCPECGAETEDDGTGNALCPDCAEAEADRQGLTDFEAGWSGRNYR